MTAPLMASADHQECGQLAALLFFAAGRTWMAEFGAKSLSCIALLHIQSDPTHAGRMLQAEVPRYQ